MIAITVLNDVFQGKTPYKMSAIQVVKRENLFVKFGENVLDEAVSFIL